MFDIAVVQELSGEEKKRREKNVHFGEIIYGLKKASLRNSDRLGNSLAVR